MDVIPSAVSVALVRLEHGNDQSGIAMAGLPTRSPWPPQPAGPPESTLSALLVGAAVMAPAVTPPKAENPQWEDVVLPS